MAGLFYAYSCSVNPGLGQLSDAGYISAMQAINRAILNPVFLFPFLGTILLLPLCAWLHYHGASTGGADGTLRTRFWLLVIASILYIIGVFGVTSFGNVPLNEVLAGVHVPSASVEELAGSRAVFERPWNQWHAVRTLASVSTAVLMILACLK
jgi:uncharacterized membrane protein